MAANNQAGAASVTMSGALLVTNGTYEHPNVGPSRVRGGMNSYFFMPSGSTAGVVDDGNPYQGMGVDPIK